MAITIGATVSTKIVAVGGSTNFNITHTTDTGTDYLIVFVFWSGTTTATVSTITWNGVALTSLGTATQSGADKVQAFGLAAPSIQGPTALTVTMSVSAKGGAVALNYLNGGATLTTGTVVTAISGSNNVTPTVTASSAAGEIVVCGAAANNGDTTTVTAGSGQTERANFVGSPAAGASSGRFLVSDEPGAASVVMDGTWSASRAWSTVAVPIKAASTTIIAVNGGNAQTAVAGANVATAPSVIVTLLGVPQVGVAVTFADTGGGSVTGASQTTDVNGIATVGSWTLSTIAGANSMTATSAGLNGSPVGFTATGTAGAATQLVMSTQPSAAVTSGVAFPQQPAVQLQDVNGNNVTTNGLTVTAALASGAVALGGTLTANTNASGTATFTNLVLTGVNGARTLSFTTGALTAAVSNGVVVSGGGGGGISGGTKQQTTRSATARRAAFR